MGNELLNLHRCLCALADDAAPHVLEDLDERDAVRVDPLLGGQPHADPGQGRPGGGDPVVVLGSAAGTEPGRFEHQACSLSAASASARERQACCASAWSLFTCVAPELVFGYCG